MSRRSGRSSDENNPKVGPKKVRTSRAVSVPPAEQSSVPPVQPVVAPADVQSVLDPARLTSRLPAPPRPGAMPGQMRPGASSGSAALPRDIARAAEAAAAALEANALAAGRAWFVASPGAPAVRSDMGLPAQPALVLPNVSPADASLASDAPKNELAPTDPQSMPIADLLGPVEPPDHIAPAANRGAAGDQRIDQPGSSAARVAVSSPLAPSPAFSNPVAPNPATPIGDLPGDGSPPPQLQPLLFEIAWEVCWQLGGIYTVLKTKASAMLDRWGSDRYCLIGPYNPQTAPLEFEEQPAYGSIRETLLRLRDEGLICYFGRWLVPGRPRTILIDYRTRYHRLNEDKYALWENHGIGTDPADGEVNETVAFGFGVTEFFRVFADVVRDRPILAHFHEWMGGVAVPRIAYHRLPVATIFTTHATLLGRYLASDNPYFYDHLPFVDAEAMAYKYAIHPRFAIEKAAAHSATVFTTVSEVTAVEAHKLLGREADVILPNGINIQRFAAPHEFQYLHQRYKERIHAFVMGHFFPSYTFDLDNTLYLFTSGRYEFRNKGMDLFIEALYQLNLRLKTLEKPPTVVAFIITKAQVKNINVGVLQNQSMFDDLQNTCEEVTEQMGRRLFQAAATHRMPSLAELIPDDSQVRLKRAMHAWRSKRQPLIVTHDLVDDANDPVLRHLRHRNLLNAADDPVKVVFHPDFLSATSPVISLDYDQFVRGCHMGIFPSYYEPWGYTPMETVALGLPAVTADLSGFGAYVQRHIDKHNERGMLVLERRYHTFEDATDRLVRYLWDFAHLNRRQRIELRNNVERLGESFDWSVLAKHYEEAHSLALQRIGAPRMGKVEVRVI